MRVFFNNLSDEIIKSLQRKKREPLMILKRFEISTKQYEQMKVQLLLNRHFKISSDIIEFFDLKIERYFEDGSSNQVQENTFKAKILKKNKQSYLEKKTTN